MTDSVPTIDEIVREFEAEGGVSKFSQGEFVPGRPDRIVRKAGGLTVNGILYPYGALINAEVVAQCRNGSTMMQSGYLPEAPYGYISPVKPIVIETAETQTPNAKVVIVADHDPVASWTKSVDAMAAQMNGDRTRAKDLLCSDPVGARLAKLALRIDSERRAVRDKTVGRRIASAL